MKRKFFLCLLFVTLCLSLAGCGDVLQQILDGLPQKPVDSQMFESKVYEDFFCYGKFTFDGNAVKGSKYFAPADEQLEKEFRQHLAHWEDWFPNELPGSKLTEGYDFDISCLTPDDYIYVYDDFTYREYGNYYLFLFDAETNTLYYFHYNV